MKKTIALIISILLIIGLFPISSAAIEVPKLPDLPDIKLPELPPLDIPELGKNYGDLLEQLKTEGFGKKKFDENLPLPEVEAPAANASVVDKFKSEFGDKWNESLEAMQTDSIIPDNIKDFVNRFGQESESMLEDLKKENNDGLAAKVKEFLEVDSLHQDLDKLKDDFEWVEPPEYKKSAAWQEMADEIRSKVKPNLLEWVNSVPKPRGYEEMEFLWDYVELMNPDNIKKFLPGFSDKDEDGEKSDSDKSYKDSVEDMNSYAKDMKQKIKDGEKLSGEDYKKGVDFALDEMKNFIKDLFR